MLINFKNASNEQLKTYKRNEQSLLRTEGFVEALNEEIKKRKDKSEVITFRGCNASVYAVTEKKVKELPADEIRSLIEDLYGPQEAREEIGKIKAEYEKKSIDKRFERFGEQNGKFIKKESTKGRDLIKYKKD